MRSARAVRRRTTQAGARALPSTSRLTVRPSARAPLAHALGMGDVLRASREALCDLQRQLDALLGAVRSPTGQPAPDSADRLRAATRRAGAAIDLLADM